MTKKHIRKWHRQLGFVCLRWPSGPTPVHGLAHRLIASAGPATEGGKDTVSKCHKGKEFPAWQHKQSD